MSGAITTLASLTSNVPVIGGLAGLVQGLISTASWRGVTFYLPTSEEEVGQRVVKFMYPGQAKADRQFLGPVDGPIRLDGMLIGDDCVAQMAKMRAAVQAPGPGKLRHPWFGQFDAVRTGEPARFSTSEQEFGLIRFTMTVERNTPPAPPTPDFFGQLQDSVDSLMSSAADFLSDAMSVLNGPLALYSFASGLLTTAASVWDGLGLGSAGVSSGSDTTNGLVSGGSDVAQAVSPAVLALQTAAPPFDANFPDTVSALLAAPAIALADASQPVEQSAIGAGPTATLSAPAVDPADAASALLQAAVQLAAPAGASAGVQAVALSAQMQAAAQAAATGATIAFTSADQAAAWRDQLDTALTGLQASVAGVAVVLPLTAGAAWRALDATRQLAIADCNARLVNLPTLLLTTTNRTMDAWKIALALFGDTPAAMPAAVVDLWARNQLINPASVPAGTYAVLPP